MTSPVIPAAITSDGMARVTWVPFATITDPSAPGSGELNDAGNLDLQWYFTDAGYQPNPTEETASSPRLASRKVPQKPGRNSETIPLIYVTNPAEPTDDAARTTLVDRAHGYLVYRPGVDEGDAYAPGDIVWVDEVILGRPGKPMGAANSDQVISQTAYVQQSWDGVTVVAGS